MFVILVFTCSNLVLLNGLALNFILALLTSVTTYQVWFKSGSNNGHYIKDHTCLSRAR
jgi:hypothetical protein